MDKLIGFLGKQPFILGDGAMGTMLQAAGLTTGGSPEEWNVTRPEVLKGIYQAYTDAGAQVITTNTFGCNRFRLGLHNFEHRVAEFNLAATSRAVLTAARLNSRTRSSKLCSPRRKRLQPNVLVVMTCAPASV